MDMPRRRDGLNQDSAPDQIGRPEIWAQRHEIRGVPWLVEEGCKMRQPIDGAGLGCIIGPIHLEGQTVIRIEAEI
jgi:hypothetical protein